MLRCDVVICEFANRCTIQSSPDIFQSIPAKPLQNLRKSALAGGAKSFEHAMHGGCATCSLTCSRPSSYCRALAQSDYQLQSNSNEQVSYCTATSPRASIPSHNITRSKMEYRSPAGRTASRICPRPSISMSPSYGAKYTSPK